MERFAKAGKNESDLRKEIQGIALESPFMDTEEFEKEVLAKI